MRVLARIKLWRQQAHVETRPRATCLRCRREYTPDPDDVREDDYCWWCASHEGNGAHRA